ncbi:MAG TPA: hypothetical protein VH370_15970 [Humisphaera sp.]|jgi:hypothetical protein|nr:hypothetical protein [Humisphaera sp.]
MSARRISQLQPFNEFRFDDCMAYLAAKYNHALSTYEMMKLHVMIDVHHTLNNAMPVIGGDIWPFVNGPVPRGAKHRVADWIKRYEEAGEAPEAFEIIDRGDRYQFRPKQVPEADDFSESELAAMELAWQEVVPPLSRPEGFAESQQFFHNASPIGEAWDKAWKRGSALDWNEIIDAYAVALPGRESHHANIKTLLRI